MAKYQSMLVVIDPNQDDQPALRRAVYLHQRIGGRIKAFLPIYDFSYEMTTLLSPDERTAMRQGVIAQRTAWIREQAKFYLESGVPIDVKVVWHNRPFEAIIQEVVSEKHDLLLKMAHQHDKLEAVIFTPTDWHLLRKCPCPVWMVKDQPWPEGGKALVAVNLASVVLAHQLVNLGFDGIGGSQCIGTGSQANGNPGGRFAVVAGNDAVGVTAQLSARHIA